MFRLPSLPFEPNEFEPEISAATIDAHYHGHHAGYIAKLNALIKDTIFVRASLDEIIDVTSKMLDRAVMRETYENACQHLLHSTYWKMLGTGVELAEEDTENIVEVAMHSFGSGWIMVHKLEEQSIYSVEWISNTGPLSPGTKLLVDVWEHAYYLDYQYKKEEAIRAFLKIITMPR